MEITKLYHLIFFSKINLFETESVVCSSSIMDGIIFSCIQPFSPVITEEWYDFLRMMFSPEYQLKKKGCIFEHNAFETTTDWEDLSLSCLFIIIFSCMCT
ncbi:MAG: hypothetical protein GY714_00015 [Desulfobacterales bacterium]|nr:hypothetical protein [Desulfobacterales bacterium]